MEPTRLIAVLLEQQSRLGPPRAWDARVPPLPWAEPTFSRRMLREHLSQAHDRASRRAPLVAAQVAWLAARLPPGAALLDAACGPGFHALALAARGYRVTGVDVGPAVIAHARAEAAAHSREVTFEEGDLRTLALPARFDAILLLYGFLHTLPPDEATRLLHRLRAHLSPGGRLFVEVRSPDNWDRRTYHDWWTEQEGLFGPALILCEHAWDDSAAAEIERYHVARADGSLAVYDVTERFLDEAALSLLLASATLTLCACHPDWPSEQPGGWLLLEIEIG